MTAAYPQLLVQLARSLTILGQVELLWDENTTADWIEALCLIPFVLLCTAIVVGRICVRSGSVVI